MTNYGHSVRFGVELTGDADGSNASRAPEAVVALAELADELGYDAVVFPDDTGNGGADASTLASWAAARTATVQVVPRLDVSTRPASVVARAAGSLQLLSRGRAMLMLGAGSVHQDLEGLHEAMSVVRTLHDTSRARASSVGNQHRLADAETGPHPEVGVPLWLCGSEADLVTLAGRFADGWSTDFEDLGVAGFAALTAIVDKAAVNAGRDVREIRRSVTLAGSDVDVSTLVDLVVNHGVSSILVRIEPGDETTLRTFIRDVAPAVRDGAERALPPGSLSSRPVRRAEVRARRRPGIAYDTIPADLAGSVVEPGDAAFAKVRSTYLRGGDPGLVLRPHSTAEVVSAIGFAREHRHLPLGIRSGGHGVSGRSTNDGGLVIDVGALDSITVLDEPTRLVRIGAGARWRDVARVLQPHGWALSSGDYGGVGVGGLATAGGIGFLARKHGLTIDHLRAVEMVLADGTLVRTSATENSELFWAVRGAGANFGVAVAFEFVVDEVDEVGWAQLAFEAPDPAAYLEAFGRVVVSTPRETTPFLILGQGIAQLMAMVDSSDPDVIVNQLQPFAEIAPLVQQQVVVAPYAAVMNMFPETPHNGRGEPVSRSAFTREITPGFASASADLIHSGASHWYQIRTVGGAVADVAPDATAYAHRDANFALTVMGGNAQRLDRWFEPVRRQSSGLYLSFESDRHPDRLTDAFPPTTLDRLRQLKAQLDPHNLFQDNFNIAPAHDHTRDAS